jgi:tRNA (cmo5U34)-methyltransferase
VKRRFHARRPWSIYEAKGRSIVVPAMSQFHFDPKSYLSMIRADVDRYDELQGQTVRASQGVPATTILELGTGTGETAKRVLSSHRAARFIGIDKSDAMLSLAREALPEAELRVQSLEDPLPEGPFELVFSALAVHHLTASDKRNLFARVAAALLPGGRFVLADVILPPDPASAKIPLSPDFDRPDRLDDQLAWLEAAGFEARITWVADDLAVIAADLPMD